MAKSNMAKAIRAARVLRRVNRSMLARTVNMSPSNISRILSGERTPKMDNAASIAKTLGLSIEDLIAGARLIKRMRKEGKIKFGSAVADTYGLVMAGMDTNSESEPEQPDQGDDDATDTEP